MSVLTPTGCINLAGAYIPAACGSLQTYRLFGAQNGPAAAGSYTGNFISGVVFTVTQGGCWFQGYWWWVGTNQSLAPVKCALWSTTGPGTGTVIPAATITSTTLALGWNWIPLPNYVPISIDDTLVAAIGVNGNFPDTNNYWGNSGPGTNGITDGPLFAFSGSASDGGTYPNWYGMSQGVYSTGGSDPSTTMPANGSNVDNFWVDVQIGTTAQKNYSGTYRLWPNRAWADEWTTGDAAVSYDVATEIRLNRSCTLHNLWYFSPPSVTQLATAADIWSVNSGGLTGTLFQTVASPTWSGAAGSGWVSTPISGTIPAGTYRVGVYNGAATPVSWSPKRLYYWTGNGSQGSNGSDAGIVGITNGPLYAPPTAVASTCYSYQGSGATESGQCPFSVGPPDSFPNQYVGAHSPGGDLFQCYWTDLEVS